MVAVNRALYIEQGTTYEFGFTWHHEGPVVDGVVTPGDPHDLTGWAVRMQIRKAQQAQAIVDATSTNGKIIIGSTGLDSGGLPVERGDAAEVKDPTNGRIDIILSDDDTDMLTLSSAKYDLEVESPSGRVYRLLEGSVTVSPNITQEITDPVVT